MEKRAASVRPRVVGMPTHVTHTPVYVLDLDEALAFYTERLGLEVRFDVPAPPRQTACRSRRGT